MASQVEGIKWVQGTNLMVDAFRFQNERCRSYFLTHFHSDHTTGLTTRFSAGLIYCSEVTARLLTQDMRMPPDRIRPLAMHTPTVVEGVTVTLLDANHCPGAVMFLFQVPAKEPGSKPQILLHTGDMRWQNRLAEHPALKGAPIDVLYFDTTYAAPQYTFPSQEEAIKSMVQVMRAADKAEPQTLFVVGAYHIGKERVFLGTARALGWRVWCPPAKLKVLRLLELPAEEMALLTDDASAARIHVCFMGADLQPPALLQRMEKGGWQQVMGFRPTGWSYRKNGLQVRKEGCATIYGIPYSEHSSFLELRDCIRVLRPKRIVPTVNAPDAARSRALVDKFADLMDLSGDRSRLDAYFGKFCYNPIPKPSTCSLEDGDPPLDRRCSSGQLKDALSDSCELQAVAGGVKGSGSDAVCGKESAVCPPQTPSVSQLPTANGRSAESGLQRQSPHFDIRAASKPCTKSEAACSESVADATDLEQVDLIQQQCIMAMIESRQNRIASLAAGAKRCLLNFAGFTAAAQKRPRI